MRPLHVTHAVLSLDCGGLERIVVDLVRAGAELDQRSSIICLERTGTLASQAEDLGARVVCLDKRPGLRLGLVRALKTVLRELNPDVLHTHQVTPLFYAGPAAKAVGVPLVVHTEHGRHYTDNKRARWLGWVAGKFAAKFFCVTAKIAEEVLAFGVAPRRKIQVVTNGIATHRFREGQHRTETRRALGIAPDAPVIGTTGRLDEIKRQDVLIRAFAQVQARLPTAELLLVGDGPLKCDLMGLAESLGIKERVHFAGYQSEPERYYQAMDLFAITSRSEGMPLAVLEAWAAGLPVIASKVGGLPDLIEEGRTGMFFPSGDETALALALTRVLADKDLARRMGEAGGQLVENRFSLEHMARAYQGHYLELLGNAGNVPNP